MPLAQVDANLLFPLHVLLEEVHVERAAKRLHRSASATSHMLARLRAALGDPLLVRKGRGLVLSARGRELRPLVARIVRDLEHVFVPPKELDLASLSRTFRVATMDGLDASVLGPACLELEKRAPNARVVLCPTDPTTLERVRRTELDLAFHSQRQVPSGVDARLLFRDRFVTLFRKGHPLSRRPLTLERFVELDHVLVSPAGHTRGVVDRVLEERGHTRRVRLVAPTFASALLLVSKSDAITTVPERMASALIGPLSLASRTPPIDLPAPEVWLVWPSAAETCPAHRFFRDLVRV